MYVCMYVCMYVFVYLCVYVVRIYRHLCGHAAIICSARMVRKIMVLGFSQEVISTGFTAKQFEGESN